MILRSLGIVLLKWFANLLAMLLFIRFVVPHEWTGYLKAAPIWVVSFAIAYVFAEWAFAKRLPGKRDLVTLIVLWLVVSYTLNIIGSILAFQTARVAIYGTDLHITYGFEILAVLLAAYVTRRRKLDHALSEGMEA